MKQRALSTGVLVYTRDAFLRMRQDDSHSNQKRIAKYRPSEIDARRLLITSYDDLSVHRDRAERRLLQICGKDAVQEIIAAYFQGRRGREDGFFDLLSFHFWQEDYLNYLKRQLSLSQQAKQSHVQSWICFRNLLMQPVYLRFMKHYFGLLLPFISEHPEMPVRYMGGVEFVYVIFAGFLAAHIKIYPALECALKQARPDLPPSIALLWELVGEAAILTPALVRADVSFKQIPGKAASSIQGRYYVSRREDLRGQVIDPTIRPDPAQTAIERCEAQSYLSLLSPQQKLIVQLQSEEYGRDEIAELLNVTEETIKTHTSRMRRKMNRLYAARN